VRRLVVTVATVTALVAALAAPSPARTTKVIRLLSTTTQARYIDRGPKGESPGDAVVSSSRLVNAVAQFGRPKGALVGLDRGTYTLLKDRKTRLDGWATLPGGKIHVRGVARTLGAKASAVAVVGGTGDFASARGTVTVSPVSSKPDPSLNVYRITLP
jgi:Dirigent-like protein